MVVISCAANAESLSPLKQIKAELNFSIKLKQLPSELTPKTSAWTDLWQSDFGEVGTGGGNSDCWDEAQASSELPSCVYGDKSATRTLVLTGDSQAWMWAPAFDAWGQSNRWKVIVLTKSACQPWPDPKEEFVNYSPFQTCHVFQSETMRFINETRPEVVVAAGLVPVVPNISVSRVKDDVGNFVSSISPSGARVLIVSPTPSFYAYDYISHSTLTAPTCLTIHPEQLKVCNDISLNLLQNYYMNSVLNMTPLPHHAQLLNLDKLLCTSKCPMIADGTLIYIDGDHVSYKWASHASGALGAILTPELKGL